MLICWQRGKEEREKASGKTPCEWSCLLRTHKCGKEVLKHLFKKIVYFIWGFESSKCICNICWRRANIYWDDKSNIKRNCWCGDEKNSMWQGPHAAGREGIVSFLDGFFSEHKCSLCPPDSAEPPSLGNIIAAFVLSTLVLLLPFWLLLRLTQRQADSGFASPAVLHPRNWWGWGWGGDPKCGSEEKMCHHWLRKWHATPAPLHPHKEACVSWPHWWASSLESLRHQKDSQKVRAIVL